MLCNRPSPDLTTKSTSFICLQFCGFAIWAGHPGTVVLVVPSVTPKAACTQLLPRIGLDDLRWPHSLAWHLAALRLGDLVLVHAVSPAGLLRRIDMTSEYHESKSRSCKVSSPRPRIGTTSLAKFFGSEQIIQLAWIQGGANSPLTRSNHKELVAFFHQSQMVA